MFIFLLCVIVPFLSFLPSLYEIVDLWRDPMAKQGAKYGVQLPIFCTLLFHWVCRITLLFHLNPQLIETINSWRVHLSIWETISRCRILPSHWYLPWEEQLLFPNDFKLGLSAVIQLVQCVICATMKIFFLASVDTFDTLNVTKTWHALSNAVEALKNLHMIFYAITQLIQNLIFFTALVWNRLLLL